MSRSEKVEQCFEILNDYLTFVDESGASHVWVRDDFGQRVFPVLGGDFRQWIQHRFWEVRKEFLANDFVKEATGYVDFRIRTDAPKCFQLGTRIVHVDDVSYLDRANAKGNVIQIDATGWKEVEAPQPLFRHFPNQKEIPYICKYTAEQLKSLPIHPYEQLFIWISVKDDDSKLLLLSWMVAVLISEHPKPLLCFTGPKGSGKSFASTVIKRLLDPTTNERLMMPDDRDLGISLSQNGVVLIDNLRGFSRKQSQMLCLASTGGSEERRILYSDNQMKQFVYKSAIILNGIHRPSEQPDLVERLMTIELSSFGKGLRKKESELWQDFEIHKDEVMNMLLDLAVAVKNRAIGHVSVGDSRMVDFMEIGERVATCMGKQQEDFVRAYLSCSNDQLADVHDDPLFQVISEMVEMEGEIHTTASKLLSQIKKKNHLLIKDYPDRITASTLGKFLTEHIHSFEEVGIVFKRGKSRSKARVYHFVYKEPPSLPSQNENACNPDQIGFKKSGQGGHENVDNFSKMLDPSNPDVY